MTAKQESIVRCGRRDSWRASRLRAIEDSGARVFVTSSGYIFPSAASMDALNASRLAEIAVDPLSGEPVAVLIERVSRTPTDTVALVRRALAAK